MPVYSYGSPRYYDDMTSPSLVGVREASKEIDLDVGSILMGSEGENAPVAVLLDMPPNGVLPRHGHDTYRVEVVVRGSMTLPDGRVLTPGDVMVTPPGDFYGPHVAGSDGVLTVEVFAAASGLAPHADPDETDPLILELLEQGGKKINAGLS